MVNALAPDGLIEGVEGGDDSYLVGVQWHPEELVESDPAMRRLFESFIECASAYEPEVATQRGLALRDEPRASTSFS